MIHTNVTSLITAWIKPPFLEKLFSVTHVTVFVPHLQAAAHPSGLPPNFLPAPVSFFSPSTRIGTRALKAENSCRYLAFALLSTTHSHCHFGAEVEAAGEYARVDRAMVLL